MTLQTLHTFPYLYASTLWSFFQCNKYNIFFCSFQKGDIFFVHNDMGDGWLWVTAHRTGEQGMIFRDLVDDLDENIDPNTVFSWFHPNVTKSEAVDMLVKGNVKCR